MSEAPRPDFLAQREAQRERQVKEAARIDSLTYEERAELFADPKEKGQSEDAFVIQLEGESDVKQNTVADMISPELRFRAAELAARITHGDVGLDGLTSTADELLQWALMPIPTPKGDR